MFHSLMETLEAYQRRDPAARSKLEIFLLYQGVHATLYHRLAHWLYCHNRRCKTVYGSSNLPGTSKNKTPKLLFKSVSEFFVIGNCLPIL